MASSPWQATASTVIQFAATTPLGDRTTYVDNIVLVAQSSNPPPLPPSRDSVACSRTTNRYLLNSGYAVGSTVVDSVGGINGTAYGTVVYSAQNSGSLEFDGSTTYLDLGVFPTQGAPLSIAFWARTDTPQADYARFFDWGSGTPNHNAMFYTLGGYATFNYFSATNAEQPTITPFVVPAGVWTHYVLTYGAAASVTIYANGASIFSTTYPFAVPSQPRSHFYIGHADTGGLWGVAPLFKGAMSDFQVFSGYALSASDALSLFNNQGCPSASPPPPPPS